MSDGVCAIDSTEIGKMADDRKALAVVTSDRAAKSSVCADVATLMLANAIEYVSFTLAAVTTRLTALNGTPKLDAID